MGTQRRSFILALCFEKQCLVVGYSDESRMRFPQTEMHFSKTPKAILFFSNEGELDLRSTRCSHEWLMLRAEGSALLDHAESLMQSWGKVNVFCRSKLYTDLQPGWCWKKNQKATRSAPWQNLVFWVRKICHKLRSATQIAGSTSKMDPTRSHDWGWKKSTPPFSRGNTYIPYFISIFIRK